MKLFGNTGGRNVKSRKTVETRPARAGNAAVQTGNLKKRRIRARRRRRALVLVSISVLAIVLGVWALLEAAIAPPKKPDSGQAAQLDAAPDENDLIDGVSPPPTPGGGYKEKFYTVLLVGTDEADYNADVIMVAAFDKENGKVNVLSVPRDTMVNVSRTNKKINASYGVGKSETGKISDGVAGLKKTLRTVIGFTPDYYCVIKFEGFKKLIDAIGGVEFNVEQTMKKSDPYISIQKGLQTLDGEHALQLVRYRDYVSGDLKRIDTAQAFLKATAKQLLAVSNVPKIPELAGIISKNLSSDLTIGELMWFANETMKLDSEEDINFYTIPIGDTGSYKGASYLFADEEGIIELVNRTVNPYLEPITAENLDIIKLSGTKSGSSGTKSTPKPTKKPAETPEPTPTPAATPEPEETVLPEQTPPEQTEPPAGESYEQPEVSAELTD